MDETTRRRVAAVRRILEADQWLEGWMRSEMEMAELRRQSDEETARLAGRPPRKHVDSRIVDPKDLSDLSDLSDRKDA